MDGLCVPNGAKPISCNRTPTFWPLEANGYPHRFIAPSKAVENGVWAGLAQKQTRNIDLAQSTTAPMSVLPDQKPADDVELLEAATDEAVAACAVAMFAVPCAH